MAGIRRISDLGTRGTFNIADNSVTTPKIANNAVVQADLSTDVPLSGMRNRIINGDMRINQRGSGVLTGSNSIQSPVDQWRIWNNVGTVTFQQSTVVPAGFTNSLLATVTGTGSYGTGGYTQMQIKIEGSNCQDFAWGTASAKPITISFWVRSSVTGTYTVQLRNGAANRSYPATYTVSSTNTWEYKTIVINGDTSGIWLTNNGIGLEIIFNLGLGTNFQTTPNTWVSGDLGSVSGAVGLAANSGATFYLTGLQVEQATQATPFEQRPVGLELALCQRYYETSNGVTQVVAGATGFGGNTYFNWTPYKVEKRIALNIVTNSTSNGVRVFATDGGADYITMWKAATQYYSANENFEIYTTQGFAICTTGGQTDAGLGRFYWYANAEL